MKRISSNPEKLAELEPFRSELAGKVVLIPGYQFTFYKTHPHANGRLDVLDLDSNQKTSTNYAIKVVEGKCTLSFNLKSKPFRIYGYPCANYEDIQKELERITQP
jgi:hypothetical protein